MNAAEIAKSYLQTAAMTRNEFDVARDPAKQHPAGRPYSSWTYRRYGCRCNRCVATVSKINTASKRRTGRLPATPRQRRHPLVAKVRSREIQRRIDLARFRAYRALAEAHPDEYRVLLEAAKSQVALESGALPGD